MLAALEGGRAEEEPEDDNQSTEDEGHDAELHEAAVGAEHGLGDEGDVERLLGALVDVLERTGGDDATTDADEGALKEETVDLGDDARFSGTAIAEESAAREQCGDEEDQGADEELAAHDGLLIDAVVEREEIGNAKDKGDGESDGEEGADDDAHDAVELFAFSIHADERNVAHDDGDEEEDGINGDDETEFIVADVGGGEAIEPGRVEEEEHRGGIAEGDIGAEAATDDLVVLFMEQAHDRGHEAIAGNKQPGNTGHAEHGAETITDFNVANRAVPQREEGGDKETLVDAEEAKRKGENGEDNDIDQTGGRRILHDQTSYALLEKAEQKAAPILKSIFDR